MGMGNIKDDGNECEQEQQINEEKLDNMDQEQDDNPEHYNNYDNNIDRYGYDDKNHPLPRNYVNSHDNRENENNNNKNVYILIFSHRKRKEN